MDTFMRVALNVREIVRKDPVLVVAVVLALCSCAAVPPDAAYAEYVDLRTIGMLFSLMTIMCGLSRLGVFRIACRHLLSVVRGPRRLALALTLLAFFSSMLITNDVALVTFVPFALLAHAYTRFPTPCMLYRRHDDHRRESRQHAHARGQPAKPLPLQRVAHAHWRVRAPHAALRRGFARTARGCDRAVRQDSRAHADVGNARRET